jgi:hypothetical protein
MMTEAGDVLPDIFGLFPTNTLRFQRGLEALANFVLPGVIPDLAEQSTMRCQPGLSLGPVDIHLKARAVSARVKKAA